MTLETAALVRELNEAADADPVHLARCAECAEAVRYRSNVTGTGFFLVDEAPDQAYGIGPNGRPVCRNGHGEMAVADDRLVPASDALAEVAAMQDAVQRSLPGVFPAFNFQGAYLELEAKAMEVDRLHKEHKAAAEEARDAKKAWDNAAELYTSMALELRRRRQDKSDPPAAEIPQAPACTWSEKHPGEACPLCTAVPLVIASHFPNPEALAAKDAQAHVEDVENFLVSMEVEETRDALQCIDIYIEQSVIAEWTADERKAVTAWAHATQDQQSGAGTSSEVPERPKVLGKAHVPAAVVGGEHQVCQFCEVVIRPASDDEAPFKVTDYVGVDCKGKPDAGHRYPETKRSKAAKKSSKTKASKGAKKASR